jgi:formamidase
MPASAADGLRTIPPRETGGNFDVRQLVAGSRVWLPVDVPGALFSIGDLHFAQGDGEVCGTAIEVAGSVTVRLRVHKVPAPSFPAYETPGAAARRSFATMGIPVGSGDGLERRRARRAPGDDRPLERMYGLARPAAYALCSVAVDLRISEVVDVPHPVVSALLPLDIFTS